MNDKATTRTKSFKIELPAEFISSLPTGIAKDTVNILGQRIANDIYSPDEIMPTEPELAASLSVSRTTIRDAIKVLSGMGLVRTARRYGTRVRPVKEWNLLDSDLVGWHNLNHPRIKRMYSETTELRTIIEPAAAALAAQRASELQIQKIENAAHAIHYAEGNLQTLFNADCQFHITLLDATQNDVIHQMRQIILTMLRISYEFGVMEGNTEEINSEIHILLAKAIRARQPDEAQNLMARMLEQNQKIAADYWISMDIA
ncbi:MAG: FCD domain-containing protein [Hyphomicrobiales bacterium]